MKIVMIFLSLFVQASVCYAQNITSSKKDSIISGVKDQLTKNFISIDKAKIVSDSLHNDMFDSIGNRDEFIRALNSKLFLLTHDKHLSVEYNPGYAKKLTEDKDDKTEQLQKERNENYGFSRSAILEGNIGYIKLNYFADILHAKEAALKAISSVKNTKALIIDLRGNSGGSGSMVQLLCSMLLPFDQITLLEIAYRRGDTVTLKTQLVDDMYKYTSRLVFILIDDKTFSAAEAFAFILKNRNAAIVIGSMTAGAGNIAGPYFLDKDYIITIPVGKIVDPVTNKGWEGIGVKPDVEAGKKDPLSIAIEMANKNRE